MNDEFGIGSHNPAVLDISPPFLELMSPDEKDQKRGAKVSGVWVQYMLIDARQVERPPDEGDVRISMGHWRNKSGAWETNGIPTPDGKPMLGSWGHYVVG